MFRTLAFALSLTTVAHAADCARPVPLRFEVTGKIVRSAGIMTTKRKM